MKKPIVKVVVLEGIIIFIFSISIYIYIFGCLDLPVHKCEELNDIMKNVPIILTIIGFLLASMLYQLRIRLQNIKEDILRIVNNPEAKNKKRPFVRAVNEMRKWLEEKEKKDASVEEREDWDFCIKEYDTQNWELKLYGIIIPFGVLIFYLTFILLRFVQVYLSFFKGV